MEDNKNDFKIQTSSIVIPSSGKDMITTEDAHSCSTYGNVTCLVVADGHGNDLNILTGRIAARYSVQLVNEWTEQNIKLFNELSTEHLQNEINNLFKTIHIKVAEHFASLIEDKIAILAGGTTLTCVWLYLRDGKMFVHTANVGDSDCKMITMDEMGVKIINMSGDHKPTNKNEWLRVNRDPKYEEKFSFVYHVIKAPKRKYPSIYRAYDPLNDQLNDNYDVDYGNPIFADGKLFGRKDYILYPNNARYEVASYLNKDLLCLAMTRSIGDYKGHAYGLTCEPEQFNYCFENEKTYIVLGTDGIWDCWDYNNFASKFMTYAQEPDSNMDNVIARIVDETKTFAIANFGKIHDDMSIIGCSITK